MDGVALADTNLPPHEQAQVRAGATLAQKVAFLRDAGSYPHAAGAVVAIETHMSWVFLAGERAYKLKKPIHLPYLDFSTLEKREAACQAEFALNRRLAPALYLGVMPLCESNEGLNLRGEGPIVDWLVVMRRIDEGLMLEAAIPRHALAPERLHALERKLGQFYRHARPVFATPQKYLAGWRRQLEWNRDVLNVPRLSMPIASILLIDGAQRRFLARCGYQLVGRLQRQKIIDGHGDLRPEHIWLGEPLSIIDCLEFNAEFRAVDPFDELSYLAIECERLGAPHVGSAALRRLSGVLSDGVTPELLAFYRCFRATLRASLSIAHLLDPAPRTPAKWRPLALRYLKIARREAVNLNRLLSRRADRPAGGFDEGVGSLAQRDRRRSIRLSSSERGLP